MATSVAHFGVKRSSSVIQEQRRALSQVVAEMGNEILDIDQERLVGDLIETYTFHVPILHPDRAETVEAGEAPGSPGSTRVVVAIPFDGQKGLFSVRPSSHQMQAFQGVVKGDELHLTVSMSNASAVRLQAAVDRQVALYQTELAVLRRELGRFNEDLPNRAAALVRTRREQLQGTKDVVAGLSYPVRRREDAIIPFPVKRTVHFAPADRTNQPRHQPEPSIPDADYEDILGATRSMGKVMERAPDSFAGLAEEGIRDFFLAVLNVGFKGQAMGEVFNVTGKTDILIRVDGRNLFVAECKVWDGKEKFALEGVPQLLKDIAWDDTKTAILLFVRRRDISNVLELADDGIRGHPCYVGGDSGAVGELERRYKFHWPGDERRSVKLALQVFAIPAGGSKRSRIKSKAVN